VGQAKRRHVLRYLAARERAGIIGTGPFDLDEALVRLDARLAKGCRWALAVAVELARTGQLPKCKACRGYRSLQAYVQASRSVLVKPTPGPCVFCEGTGHNTSAQLPWPAWLMRKGEGIVGGRVFGDGGWLTGQAWIGWWFEGAREDQDEHSGGPRTRSFPRGRHYPRDPWQTLAIGGRPPCAVDAPGQVAHWPRWFAGDIRHAEQRRERDMRRPNGRTWRLWRETRQQGVEDLLRGSLTTARAATSAEPAEQVRLAVEAAQLYAAGALGVGAASEMERWHTEVRGQADALGYAFQQQRISGNSLGLADRLRVPLDVDVLQRGTVLMSVDGATMPVTIADGVMRLDSGQRLMLMPDGSVTAHVRSWHRRHQALDERTQPVEVHVAVERDGPTE
jgi:hypothetical protein